MSKELMLGDLIAGMGEWRPVGLEIPISVVVDSRKASAGAVFFAFEGENVDGHDFVADAFERGAVAAVVSREVETDAQVLDLENDPPSATTLATPLVIRVPEVLTALQDAAHFWRRQLSPRVIGITGSVGKTTTKEVLSSVLAQRYHVLRSASSYNNEIGVPLTLLCLTEEHERLVLEMGMYVRGDIDFLAGMAQPHVGIITNVAPVHAERAGSIENIALGKRELVEALPPAPEGVAILNYDDTRVRAMAEHTEAHIFFYGFTSEADLWADEVESLGLDGIRVRLHYKGDQLYVRAPLLGRHSAHTVLRATAGGLVEGLTWQEIIEGLRSPGAQLRLVTVEGPNDSLILDDTYNASPPSTLAALNLLRDLEANGESSPQTGRRKIAVLGDMLELGDYEEAGHLKVGCRAASVVSELVAVGDQARVVARGAELCGLARARIHIASDSAAAVEVLCEILEAGDIILVKGSRAMRMEKIVAKLSEEDAWHSH